MFVIVKSQNPEQFNNFVLNFLLHVEMGRLIFDASTGDVKLYIISLSDYDSPMFCF
jgi:hypothetical protein